MSLFKSKRKNQITSEFDTTSQSALLPIQNVYSAYNRLPSPVLSVDQSPPDIYKTSSIHSSNHQYEHKPNENNHKEKFSHQQALIKEAEERAAAKLHKKSPYSRFLCCFCFPCLPMWTRTICCFIFLALCGFSCLILFFALSFKQPQIVLNGSHDLAFEYSVYNGNYFEMNFEKIKAVVYYPTLNKPTVGVGEISDLVLRPHAVTNITFPIQILGGTNDSNNNGNKTTKTNDIESVLKDIVASSCLGEADKDLEQKQVDIMYDLMPTFRFGDYGVLSLSFTGKTTSLSCEKLQSMINNH